MDISTEEKRRLRREYMRKYRASNPDYVERARVHTIQYYKKHQKKHLEYALKRQAAGREFINTFKGSPCMDCGRKFPPYVMDFDHVRGEKQQNVGEMGCYKIESILDEIAKCDLVCANCHRIRTYNRQHNLT